MKFGGNILENWFQDELSREKVKLSGHSGELANARRVGAGESRGLGVIRKIYPIKSETYSSWTNSWR